MRKKKIGIPTLDKKNKNLIQKFQKGNELNWRVCSELEARKLIKKAQKGDKKSKDLLIKAFDELINTVIEIFIGSCDEIDRKRFKKAGKEGLTNAIDRFDLTKKFKFTQCAFWLIRRAIEEEKQYPIFISDLEARKLIKKAQKGDKKSKDFLIKAFDELINTVIEIFIGSCDEIDRKRFKKAGKEGLNAAIKHFKLTRDFKFAPYAYWWIKQAIKIRLGIIKSSPQNRRRQKHKKTVATT